MMLYRMLVVSLFLFLSCGAAIAAPKAEVSTDLWNMGEIYQWSTPATEVEIRNTGDSDLDITDVKSSCGCTVATPDNKTIKPGSRTGLKIKFAAYNFTGRVNKVVRVTTNDPVNPVMVIAVKGFIKPDKSAFGGLKPDYIDLGIVPPTDTRRFEVRLDNLGNTDMKVLGVDLPDGYTLDSSLPGAVPEKDVVAVSIRFAPPKSRGPVSDTITFRVAGARQETLTLKVEGYIGEQARVGDSISLSPSGFKVKPGKGPAKLEVTLKNEGGSPVMVEGVESSFETVSADSAEKEVKPGQTVSSALSLKPESLKPGEKGYVYIRVAIPVEVEGAEAK